MSESWRPTTSLAGLQARDNLNKKIRQFFSEKKYLEVDVPLLGSGGTTDRHIQSFQTQSNSQHFYLQTSPEFAMKRLLAFGSGPIYALTKAFRQEEIGRYHNTEFTMLEWYRPGFDDHALMEEMVELLKIFFDFDVCKHSYGEIFQKHLGINPYIDSVEKIKSEAVKYIDVSGFSEEKDRDVWLNLLFSHIIQPRLTHKLYFIYDYPKSQSALARIEKNNDGEMVARRFELFINGVELANGYWELTDATEQKKRFEDDNKKRRELNLPEIKVDQHLVDALSNGLDECAGVALGVDRLLMLVMGVNHLQDVIAFPADRA